MKIPSFLSSCFYVFTRIAFPSLVILMAATLIWEHIDHSQKRVTYSWLSKQLPGLVSRDMMPVPVGFENHNGDDWIIARGLTVNRHWMGAPGETNFNQVVYYTNSIQVVYYPSNSIDLASANCTPVNTSGEMDLESGEWRFVVAVIDHRYFNPNEMTKSFTLMSAPLSIDTKFIGVDRRAIRDLKSQIKESAAHKSEG